MTLYGACRGGLRGIKGKRAGWEGAVKGNISREFLGGLARTVFRDCLIIQITMGPPRLCPLAGFIPSSSMFDCI